MHYADRFNAKISRGECWEWTGGLTPAGYGKFWLDGRTVLAHRLSYELHVGPIPPGMQLDHLCRRRSCVRPDHLQPVTIRDNLLRGVDTLAALNVAKTHCRNGHEFTDANTYRPPDGSRVCRECQRAKDRRRYWKARAAK